MGDYQSLFHRYSLYKLSHLSFSDWRCSSFEYYQLCHLAMKFKFGSVEFTYKQQLYLKSTQSAGKHKIDITISSVVDWNSRSMYNHNRSRNWIFTSKQSTFQAPILSRSSWQIETRQRYRLYLFLFYSPFLSLINVL